MGWAKKNVPGYKAVSNTVIDPISKPLEKAATAVLQPVEKAIVQPINQGLASLDKMVGKAIPGGWGTVASIAGSAMGVPTPYLVGLGALQGSGVTRKGGSFNLQGALIGGATAYATAELGDYLRSAAPGAEGIAGVTPPPTVDAAGNIINQATGQVGSGLAGNASGLLPPPPPPSVFSQVMSGNFGDALSQVGTNIGTAASNAGQSIINAPSDAFNAISNYDYSGAIDKGLSNASQTGAGIKNLLTGPAGVSKTASALSGVNPVTMGGMALYGSASLSDLDAQRNFLKEQQAAGNIAQAEYDAAMAEINRSEAIARDAVARNPFDTNPDRSATIGDTDYRRADAEENLYGRFDPSERLFAMGGSVDDEAGMDEARGLGLGNLSNGFMNMGSTPAYDKGGKVSTSNSDKKRRDYLDMLNAEFMSPPSQYVEGMGFMSPPQSVGGRLGANLDALGGNLRAGLSGTAMRDQEGNIRTMPGMLDVGYKGQVGPGELDVGLQRAIRAMPGRNKDYALNAKYSVKFAEGGQPRFLSGGGDGMSDSIKANINGTQEARLADGEFVIPADVVSHLGNGSSKAGAKRLYSMMDKVRTARTGTKRQGKQINPKQFMPV
jgi:hypothetical protein